MSDDSTPPDSGSTAPDAAERRRAVRDRYAAIAAEPSGCCETEPSPRGESDSGEADRVDNSSEMGYSTADVESVAPGANLGLGCGNPTAIANLESGDTVLDLGSGAGFDCFLAAQEVGDSGRVIGVDMTPEMIERARENVAANDATNVEFRLGEIEHLPVADGSVDVIISNCVINLSPDKPQVFREAFRVLRPGGRLAVSDVVVTAPLPPALRADMESVAGCVGGASSISELESMLTDAGFVDVSLEPKEDSAAFIREWDDERDLSEFLVSARIAGRKPAP
ncbi:arsenite methyltransferase [Natrononativus amylolyticus]|uniref:arsenite methyltransferase n=1 Tax=Natrononativus amylolyticus TaxID=2963434 RepID=UPI0020CF4447|nr:arsenite methyltransferase [Natrononativus amylolyticus]